MAASADCLVCRRRPVLGCGSGSAASQRLNRRLCPTLPLQRQPLLLAAAWLVGVFGFLPGVAAVRQQLVAEQAAGEEEASAFAAAAAADALLPENLVEHAAAGDGGRLAFSADSGGAHGASNWTLKHLDRGSNGSQLKADVGQLPTGAASVAVAAERERRAAAQAPVAGPGAAFVALGARTSTSPMYQFLDFSANPDHLCVLAYAALFVVCLGKTWLQHGDTAAEKSYEVRQHRDSLQQAYAGTMAASQDILLNMFESSAYLAEWNLDTKRRNFEKFLRHVEDSPERLTGGPAHHEASVEVFRTFLMQWLSVFEQCSADPLKKPNQIVSSKDLEKCQTLCELAGFVADRLAVNEVTFIKLFVTAVKRFEYKIKQAEAFRGCWLKLGCFGFGFQCRPFYLDEPDGETEVKVEPDKREDVYPLDCLCGCLQVTLLSQAHLLVLCCLFLSGAVLWLEIHVKKYVLAGAVLASLLVVLSMLFRIRDIDEFARLVHEVQELEQVGAAVQEHHNKLDKFCGKLRRLDHLWRYRTVPCLDLLGELHDRLWEMSPETEDKFSFLEGMTRSLQDMLAGLGPLNLWFLEADQSAELLELAGEQLNACTDFVETHRNEDVLGDLILQRVNRAFGAVIVRVLSAHNLTNKATLGLIGDISNPYATVRTNSELILRTATIERTLDPVWEEEFFLPIEWDDEHLEIHVWSQVGDADGGDPSLGYLQVNFRDMLPGVWHKSREHLTSVRKKVGKKSELQYDVYFATDLRQLYWAESAGEMCLQRMSQFLADFS